MEASSVPTVEHGLSVNKTVQTGTSVLACAAAVALLYYGRGFFITLTIAIMIAFLLDPVVTMCVRFRLPRPVASFVVCSSALLLLYLLEERYTGIIHKSDLASTNAYNTYKHPGLPPGPIASPGMASLKAALAPAETNYMYFVAKADGSGGHNFSSTLAEHSRAVAAYRSAQKHP